MKLPPMKAASILVLALALLGSACGSNRPPRLVSIGNQEVAVNQTLEILVGAVDGDGDALTFSVRDAPEGSTFEPLGGSALFRWTPIASDVPAGQTSATYAVTFLVADPRGSEDGETILITVSRGAPGEGAPVFVTPSDYALDLSTTDTLDVTVAVQDDDSASVNFTLADGPAGAQLFASGAKSAQLTWRPSEAQVQARTLYFFRVVAADSDHEPVEQTITVLLRRKNTANCPGAPPVITHVPLSDQSGPGPYRVEARIFDNESTVRTATLFWSRVANPTPSDFLSTPLSRDPGAPDLFAANLPDLGLATGESATVSYFICATDDDDAAGVACDLSACSPDGQQHYVFVASADSATCTDDALEPNDSAAAARSVTPGTPQRALRLCGPNEDWFQVDLATGEILDAQIAFTHVNGDLDLEVYAPDRTTRLVASASSTAGTNEETVQVEASTAGAYYLRVLGAAGVTNTYDLTASVRAGGSCEDDAREPNDSSSQAVTLEPGSYGGLTVCSGNDDWYQVLLRAGQNLRVSLAFIHADGDLDLEVYRPDRTTRMGLSDGVTDTELLSFNVVPETGLYYIRVYGYDGSQNDYTLDIDGGQCLDDGLEENDTRETARAITAGTLRTLAVCGEDQDWYAIDVAQGQGLRVDLRFLHIDGDLDLKVVGPDGSTVGSSLSTTDNELVEVPPVSAAGTYSINVFTFTGAENAYDLDVALVSP